MYGVGIGTKTSTGGEVVEGNAGIKFNGLVASSIGHQATCNSGRKECNGIGPIVPVGPRDANLPAGPAARVGDYVDCGCPPNSNVIVGSSSVSVGAASASGVATATVQSLQTTSSQVQNVASHAAQASGASKSAVSLNPNNAYWPPYNPLAKEGEKNLEVEYTQEVVRFAVLEPTEWKVFFDSFDYVKTMKDTVTGLYNAKETAKALGGMGVVAFVKTVDGVEYLILKNYDKWSQTLLHGGVFKANNAQVVKLGLGALGSVKGMTQYVRVTAPMEILVGSAVNVLQFIVNDEYTLEKLGVDEAKLFVHAIAVAGVALGAGAVFTGVAATVAGKVAILVLSNAFVWGVDKWTDFEKKIIEQTMSIVE
jgi:uncharacterized Zn-binding protein involved in type VI secretion